MDSKILNPVVRDYIYSSYRPLTPELEALRTKGEEDMISIILPETEMLLSVLLRLRKPEKILEIGTAIGYSAVYFAQSLPEAKVVTIERDEYAFAAARENIRKAGCENRIEVLLGDGQEQIEKLKDMGETGFDFVFIDAGKSHYRRFLDGALSVCSPEAVIVSDNILQRGMTAFDGYDEKGKHKTNIRRMREYVEFITSCTCLSTSILSAGDGVAVSIYKG